VLYADFHEMALGLPGAAFDVKWGSERCFCVGDKMFAIAGHLGNDTPRYLFKASEMGFEMLTGAGLAAPAPYLGRSKWVQLTAHDALDPEALGAYVRQSHALVAAGLARKLRAQLGIVP